MSHARERHNQYLLEHLSQHAEDPTWIERELPQIKRAWTWVSLKDNQDAMLRYVWGLQKFFAQRGMFQFWSQWAEQTVALTSSIADEEATSSMLIHLGYCHWNLGNFTKALAAYRRAYEIVSGAEDMVSKARILNSMGMVYYQMGDLQEGISFLNEAKETYRLLKDIEGTAIVLLNLGWMYRSLRQIETALELSTQALSLFQQLANPLLEAKAFNNLAILHYDRGDLPSARINFENVCLR